MKTLFLFQRRPIVLLEVLIAFALVALCVLPLIYPHVFILRSEKKFVSTVELDHLVNLLYADRLQKLYQNEIPWSDIENGKEIPIDIALLNSLDYKEDLPFTGTYQFVKVRQKPPKPADTTVYLYDLTFTFLPKPGLFLEKAPKDRGDVKVNPDQITYKYQVAIERILK